MPILVQVDDETLEFPDDMSDSDIQSVLQKEYPSAPQQIEAPGPDFGVPLEIPRGGEELARQNFETEESLRRSGLLGPATRSPSLSQEITQALSVSPQTTQNAVEVFRANQIANNLRALEAQMAMSGLDIPRTERDQVLAQVAGGREAPPSTGAQVFSGVQNAAAGLIGGMTDPTLAAPIAAAAMFPPIAPVVSAGFGAHMTAQVPELARAAGTASVVGTPYEKANAYANLAGPLVFVPSLGVHAASPMTRPAPMEIPRSIQESVPARQTPIERTQNAIQQEAASTVRNVQQAEVAPESARQVPSEVSSPKAPEALTPAVQPEVVQFVKDYEAFVPQKAEVAVAAGMTSRGIPDLQAMLDATIRVRQQREAVLDSIKKETDPAARMTLMRQTDKFGGSQYTREAIEAATGIGSQKRADSPLNYKKNPEVAQWLKDNAEAIWPGKNSVNRASRISELDAALDNGIDSPQSAKSFGSSTGLEFRGETTIGGKAYNFHDPISGNSVTLKAGTSLKDAASRVESVRAGMPSMEAQPGITPEQVPALGYLPRQSEALGLGEPSMPPTVESVRAQRAAEARPPQPPPKEPSTTEFPTEGENVQMRKSAERATTSEMIPEPVQETIKTAPESFYRQQSMRRVEEIVTEMPDAGLATVPRDSNLYTAAKLEQANRLFKRGKNDAGYEVFVELEKEGTRLGQLINQFKMLKGTRPEEVARVINKTLEKAGKDPLNKAQEKVAIETAKKSKDADTTLDESTSAWEKNPTPENAAKAEKALLDANEAGLELQRFVSKFQPRSTASIIKSVLQGNLLTPISEVANLVGNTSFLPFRAADRGVATTLDIMNNYLRGSKRDITVQPIRGTAEALKGFGRGMKQVPDIFMRGTGDVIKGETRAGLHPIQAWINQFAKNPEMPTTKGKLTLQDRVNLAIEGTLGVPAEAMLRGLGAGDVGFKEAAKARATATELSLANVPKSDWSFAQKFPELFLDAKALERIQSDTLQAVFQRPSNTLNVITNWIRGRGELFDLALATVAPYKLTPWNIVGEILSYNPLVAFARSISDYKKGNSRLAKLNAGKYVVGSALTAAGWWLYKNGLMSPSLDQRDESQKARVLAGEVLPPNHINISGLKRTLSGGDPAFKPGDETADVFRAGGLAGSMFYMTANIGRDFERSPEVPDSEVWGAILRQSTLEQARFGMNQSFLSGVEGLLSAVREGNADNYIRQWGNTVASIPLPNTLTVMSRASREFKPDFREDTFRKQMENIVRNKLGVAGLDDYLPLKRDLWGEPMRETPEGRNAIMYHFFDVFKNKQVTSDPVPLELFRLWRKTTDTRVIPSLPEKSLTVSGTTYNLTSDQQSRYADLVGQSRRQIADAVVVNPNFHKLNDEQKIDLLDRAYRAGLQRGKVQFWRESGGPAGLSTKPQRAGFQQE